MAKSSGTLAKLPGQTFGHAAFDDRPGVDRRIGGCDLVAALGFKKISHVSNHEKKDHPRTASSSRQRNAIVRVPAWQARVLWEEPPPENLRLCACGQNLFGSAGFLDKTIPQAQRGKCRDVTARRRVLWNNAPNHLGLMRESLRASRVAGVWLGS